MLVLMQVQPEEPLDRAQVDSHVPDELPVLVDQSQPFNRPLQSGFRVAARKRNFIWR